VPANQQFRKDVDDADLVASKCADAFANWIAKTMPNDFLGTYQRDRFAKFPSSLTDYLKELSNSFDVDVIGEDRSIALRFKSPTIIRDRRVFAKQTAQVLTANWNHLRVAAVAAEWLVTELGHSYDDRLTGHRHINIVSNLDMFTIKAEDEDHPDIDRLGHTPLELFHYRQMVRKIKNLLQYIDERSDDVCLTWYAFRNLEHHMTIASWEQDKFEDFKSAMYFWRAGKNTSVSPVFLSEEEDIADLATYFDKRLQRSTAWLRGEPNGKIFEKRTGQALEMPHDQEHPVLANLANALEALDIRVMNVRDPQTSPEAVA